MEATRRSRGCDLFIVIGSTLVVYPAADMPAYARKAGARLAIVNLTPTPLDHHATVVIQGKAGEIITQGDGKGETRMIKLNPDSIGTAVWGEEICTRLCGQL